MLLTVRIFSDATGTSVAVVCAAAVITNSIRLAPLAARRRRLLRSTRVPSPRPSRSATRHPLPARRPQAGRGKAKRQLDLSQGSERFGQPAFEVAYSFAADWISGSTLSFKGSIHSDPLVHFVPSHFAM